MKLKEIGNEVRRANVEKVRIFFSSAPDDEVYTANELGNLLNLTPQAVRGAIHNKLIRDTKLIRKFKIGHSTLFGTPKAIEKLKKMVQAEFNQYKCRKEIK